MTYGRKDYFDLMVLNVVIGSVGSAETEFWHVEHVEGPCLPYGEQEAESESRLRTRYNLESRPTTTPLHLTISFKVSRISQNGGAR